MTPLHILAMLGSIGALVALLMAVFPKEGLTLGGQRLKFITWSSLLRDTSAVHRLGDIDAYLASVDTTRADMSFADSLHLRPALTLTSIQFKNNDASSLYNFFQRAREARAARTNVHVFHYGDSQIESDRISSLLRQELQQLFGGGGPGWLAPLPVTSTMSIRQQQSEHWLRYTAYGYDKGKLPSGQFGALAASFRFLPPSETVAADTSEAWLEFSPSGKSGGRNGTYDLLKIWLGYHRAPLDLEVWINDSLHYLETIAPANSVLCKRYHIGRSPEKLRLVFRGTDSPEVHGIVLEEEGGVNVDNIALRGSDGTLFRRLPSTDLKAELTGSDAGLVLLQFGGNAMPYIKSAEGATQYGESFAMQIRYLRSLLPDAAFIVIGPSDMSQSVDGQWQSYPYLEQVRDALKNAALETGCGFWDMYTVMGGKNAMISWVSNQPPYAGDDHVHFTPAGAKKVAGLLCKAIKEEYDAWNAQIEKQKIPG